MCSFVPIQFRWLKGHIYCSCYYHNHIGSIHLSHCYHIFLWLCAGDVCYILFCHLLHIHSRKTGILFSLLLRSLWWVKNSGIRFGLQITFVFVHYTISLSCCANVSEDIELKKCMSDIFCVECVSKIEHILSVIHYIIYGTVCFQFTHSPCDEWENICIHIYISFVLSSSSNRKYEL